MSQAVRHNGVLTGRRRFRLKPRLFGDPLIILQVEVKGMVSQYMGGGVDTDFATWWQDAKVEDLTVEDVRVAKVS